MNIMYATGGACRGNFYEFTRSRHPFAFRIALENKSRIVQGAYYKIVWRHCKVNYCTNVCNCELELVLNPSKDIEP